MLRFLWRRASRNLRALAVNCEISRRKFFECEGHQRPKGLFWLPEERCVPQTTCWGLRKADLGGLEGGMGLGKATWRVTVPLALPKQELSRGGESRWNYFQQVWSPGQCYCILGETTQGNYSKGFRSAMTTLWRRFQQNPYRGIQRVCNFL